MESCHLLLHHHSSFLQSTGVGALSCSRPNKEMCLKAAVLSSPTVAVEVETLL